MNRVFVFMITFNLSRLAINAVYTINILVNSLSKLKK